MRAISTVFDVAVFLLLVSAAVATLALPSDSPPETDVDGVASTLGTARIGVAYPVTLDVTLANGSEATISDRREANGTVGALLADAAVSEAAFGGGATGFEAFRSAVRERLRALLRWAETPTLVEARWHPYRGSPLDGDIAVGPAPPSSAITVATLDVPGPVDPVRERAKRAARRGFDAVARTVADATVRGLYPTREMRLALQGGGIGRGVAIRRYRRLLDPLDIDVGGAVRDGRAGAVNAALVDALAERFERDMRSRFPSPAAAASAVRAGRVRVVVRGWER